MSALSYLRKAGLAIVSLPGETLRVSPGGRITPELRQFIAEHKAQLLVELAAINEMPAPWLHLLVLADGRTIQRCGELITATVEREARLQFGDDLLTVVAVAGIYRPLTEEEIVKALAGAIIVPVPPPPSSSTWLEHVADLLGAHSAELLKFGHLAQHELAELAGTDPSLVAATIRGSPAWINRTLP